MTSLFKMLKPYDYLLILLTLVMAFMPSIFSYRYYANQSTGEVIAIVKIDGEKVDEFLLGPNTDHEEETYYPHGGQYNIIEKDNEQIRVKEDNSPDQIAVNTGWISEPGQTSICLPYGLIIEIQGAKEIQEDDLILPL